MEKEAVICAVLVFVTATAVPSALGATDVYMECPDYQWVRGNTVSFKCSVLKTAYPTQCKTSTDRFVEFRRSPNGGTYVPKCALADVLGSCLSSSLDCSCDSENTTHYNYNYTFEVTADSSGSWDCNVPCKAGLIQPLTYSSNGGCENKAVLADLCGNSPCKHCATCIAINSTNVKCICNETYYYGDFCEISKCFKNGQCKRGTCRINENNEDVCDCTGTGYIGTSCEKLDPILIALICVSSLLGVVMAAGGAGVYCARKQTSGGQQNAPPADAPAANAPLANDPHANDPRYNTHPDNAPPDNAPQVAGSAGPSTCQTVPTTPYDEPDQSSVAGSEASEGTEYSASEVPEV